MIRDKIGWEGEGEIKEYVQEIGAEFKLARCSIVETDFIGRKECYGKEDYRICRAGW